jgi:hypothetical protein
VSSMYSRRYAKYIQSIAGTNRIWSFILWPLKFYHIFQSTVQTCKYQTTVLTLLSHTGKNSRVFTVGTIFKVHILIGATLQCKHRYADRIVSLLSAVNIIIQSIMILLYFYVHIEILSKRVVGLDIVLKVAQIPNYLGMRRN